MCGYICVWVPSIPSTISSKAPRMELSRFRYSVSRVTYRNVWLWTLFPHKRLNVFLHSPWVCLTQYESVRLLQMTSSMMSSIPMNAWQFPAGTARGVSSGYDWQGVMADMTAFSVYTPGPWLSQTRTYFRIIPVDMTSMVHGRCMDRVVFTRWNGQEQCIYCTVALMNVTTIMII